MKSKQKLCFPSTHREGTEGGNRGIKVKAKFTLEQATKAPRGSSYSFTLPSTSVPRPGHFTPGYPIVQEAGWAPGPVWTCAENLAPPPGFDPRTVQPVASRYIDWAIPAPGTEVFLRLFLISALYGGKWFVWGPGHFTLEEDGLQSGFGHFGEEKKVLPLLGIKPPTVQTWVSRYTDFAHNVNGICVLVGEISYGNRFVNWRVFMFKLVLGAFTKLWKATISFVFSVSPSAWNNLAPTGRIFMKFGICVFFENLSRKIKFHYY